MPTLSGAREIKRLINELERLDKWIGDLEHCSSKSLVVHFEDFAEPDFLIKRQSAAYRNLLKGLHMDRLKIYEELRGWGFADDEPDPEPS